MRSKLNEAQKDRVVELYQANKKQSNIAKYFNVSPRTINRILIEKGMAEAPEDRELRHKQLLRICDDHKLTPQLLRNKLAQPEFNYEFFKNVLAEMPPEAVGSLIYQAFVEKAAKKQVQQEPSQQSLYL